MDAYRTTTITVTFSVAEVANLLDSRLPPHLKLPGTPVLDLAVVNGTVVLTQRHGTALAPEER